MSQYNKQEVCSLTIFDLTAQLDLQHAFNLFSQMISPPSNTEGNKNVPQQSPSCVLRGKMKNRSDLGLNITLIRDDDGIANCFCVALIQNPVSPIDTFIPIYATVGLLQAQQQQVQGEENEQGAYLSYSTFMTG
jgi:hypothetical protein